MKPIQFVTRHCARFSDIDSNGHVSTQHYLSYFIEHRFTGLRERLGLDLKTLSGLPVTFFVKEVKLSLVQPLHADEMFQIESQITQFGPKGCVVECTMKANASDKLISRCVLELVCIDKNKLRPCDWPEDFKARFFET